MPKFYNPCAEYVPQNTGMYGLYEKIEKAGRCCYKSEGKTEYDEEGRSITAEMFAKKLLNVFKHLSVAEHANVYLKYQLWDSPRMTYQENAFFNFYDKNPYSRVNSVDGYLYITTNLRVLIENEREDDLKYMCDPTNWHDIRHTIRVFTDRGVSAEANRHRVDSPSERSTRYVNYGHDDAVSINIPTDFTEDQIEERECIWAAAGIKDSSFFNMCSQIVDEFDQDDWDVLDYWLFSIYATEFSYMNLLRLGWKPQQARRVLTLSTQTELYITAYEDDWVKFIGQRYFGTTGTPHPDMKELTGKIIKEFEQIESITNKVNLLYR